MCACEYFGMDFQFPRAQSFPLFCVGKLEQSVRFERGSHLVFRVSPDLCCLLSAWRREAAETSGLEGVLFTSSRTPQYHVPPGI